MQRGFFTTLIDYIPGTESYDVKNFKDSSTELKKMREILLNNPNTQMSDQLREIEDAKTFSAILEATERLDFHHSKDSTVRKLGPTLMNAVLFFAGYKSPEANYAYYGSHFREKAKKTMCDAGYVIDEPRRRLE